MDLSLFFAGTGGSAPTPRRGLPAIVLRRGAEQILVDCGEGTQRQLMRSIGLTELDEVLITHLHADHWLGLLGLLKTYDLRSRERPLTVRGPRGTRDLLEGVMRYSGRTGYDLTSVPVRHRGSAFGYLFAEHDRPGVFDVATATALGVTPGPDFGRLQRGETVAGVRPEQVMGPVRRGRRIVLSGDTRPCDAIVEAAEGADVLVHESTFAIEDAERAYETAHSTAAQAAGVARDAGVRLLALNHIGVRYPPSVLRDEAREIFPAAVLPRDFDTIELPFPERGAPRLVRFAEQSGDRAPDPAAVADKVPAQ